MEANSEIAELMRECDIPDQHPIDGLLECVRISGSMMRLLTMKVGELAEDPEVAGGDAFWGLNKDGEMAPHIYISLLKTWTERYERACKTALESGIEERRIHLAEDTASAVFTALRKATVIAGVPPAMQAALMQSLASELRVSPS